MGKTVGELLYGPMPISAYEVAEWMSYYEILAKEQKKAASPSNAPRKMPMGARG